MKKKFNIFVLVCFLWNAAPAQVICIFCYEQNDSISSNVNNLLQNGGFENSNCTPGYIVDVFCPNSTLYSCNLNNWTCTGGGNSTYACVLDSSLNSRSIIVEGAVAVYLGNYFCNACSQVANDTSCVTDSGCVVTGIPAGYPENTSDYGGTIGVSIEQTVTGLVPGNTYVLEFWAGGEDNQSIFSGRGIFAVDVGFGNILLRCNQTPHSGGIGTTYIIEFMATSSSHTIKFTNWGHICSACTEVVLDNARLYTLAELSSSVPPCSSTAAPVVNLASSDTSWCDKKAIDYFDLSTNNPTSWQWFFPGAVPDTSTLQNPQGIYYPAYGSFDVKLIACNAAGCDTLFLPGFINEFQVPASPTITVSNDTMFVPFANSYQWYFNSILIPGATDSFYVYLQQGSYYVIITDSNGCASSSGIVNTGIESLGNTNPTIEIFPNPSDGNFEITEASIINKPLDIKIFDKTGREVFTSFNTKNYKIKINVPDGIYCIQIFSGNKIYHSKFVIINN